MQEKLIRGGACSYGNAGYGGGSYGSASSHGYGGASGHGYSGSGAFGGGGYGTQSYEEHCEYSDNRMKIPAPVPAVAGFKTSYTSIQNGSNGHMGHPTGGLGHGHGHGHGQQTVHVVSQHDATLQHGGHRQHGHYGSGSGGAEKRFFSATTAASSSAGGGLNRKASWIRKSLD